MHSNFVPLFASLSSAEPVRETLDGGWCKSRVEMNGIPINGMFDQQHFGNGAGRPGQVTGMQMDLADLTSGPQVDNLTNSAMEHASSVAMQRGYDSMLQESLALSHNTL